MIDNSCNSHLGLSYLPDKQLPEMIRRTLTHNMAKDRRMSIVLERVLREILAPIWAPIAAPMLMQIAGSQTT